MTRHPLLSRDIAPTSDTAALTQCHTGFLPWRHNLQCQESRATCWCSGFHPLHSVSILGGWTHGEIHFSQATICTRWKKKKIREWADVLARPQLLTRSHNCSCVLLWYWLVPSWFLPSGSQVSAVVSWNFLQFQDINQPNQSKAT